MTKQQAWGSLSRATQEGLTDVIGALTALGMWETGEGTEIHLKDGRSFPGGLAADHRVTFDGDRMRHA
jgi:hypothetical protein